MDRWTGKLFLAAEGVLYAAFLTLDLCGHMADSIPIKYTGIVLCLWAALPAARTADGRLTALALAFTAAADWFLLVLNRHYVMGLLLFCIVQALYGIRLACWRGRGCPAMLAVRLAPIGLFFVLHPVLDALALLYFVNLVCNALEAALFLPRSRYQHAFAAGLALFVCCDICVGAYNLGLLYRFTQYGMWMFYLPAQVLIVRSAAAAAH